MNRYICGDSAEAGLGEPVDLSGLVVDSTDFLDLVEDFWLKAGDVRRMEPGHMFICFCMDRIFADREFTEGEVCDPLVWLEPGFFWVGRKIGPVGSMTCQASVYSGLKNIDWKNKEKLRLEIESSLSVILDSEWDWSIYKGYYWTPLSRSGTEDDLNNDDFIGWHKGALVDMKYIGMMPKILHRKGE